MIIEQYYLQCLSQASYLIGDQTTGRAVIVDPRRDIEEYLHDAEKLGLRIEMVLETHLHADFLSGHLEFAQTGAEIGYGSVAQPEFPARLFDDGERYSLGQVTLEILHTPGHTPESISVAIYETGESPAPHAVLTGDTLFIGDVGRPDLLVSSGWSKIELAGMLYDSLHEKLLTMPDDTVVYPAHGAGSACGKNLSSDTWSTIGAQRTENPSIRIRNRNEFIESITEGQPAQPMYFSYNASLNAQLRTLRVDAPPLTLSRAELERRVGEGAAVLDVRSPEVFALGHFPGAINVGLEGRFAEFAGSVIGPTTPIVLCGTTDQVNEAQKRLARIGYDQIEGSFAPESIPPEQLAVTLRPTALELRERLSTDEQFTVLDVRNPGELEEGAIEGSVHIPLAELNSRMGQLTDADDIVVYCAGGYRSSIAASVLRAELTGSEVSDLVGGFAGWEQII